MGKKTTIQDIADALGISRNTVSKAINNSDGIADATREKILQKAIEMDYKQFSYVSTLLSAGQGETAGTEHKGTIALFNITYLSNSHFASTMMDKIHEEISRLGYSFVINRVSHENIENLTLPKTFDKDQVTAIICTEIFDPAYSDMICSLGIPVLFVDGPARRGARSVQADQLMMDNKTEITRFVTSLIDRGITRIGFIGDYDHCQSFWERYNAFRFAMISADVAIDKRFILKPHETFNRNLMIDELGDLLDNLDEMPDAFICANDFVAIDAMQLLAQRDRKLLKKIRFLGFDDSHESRIFYPALSTVHIHSQAMAFSALHLLVSRIEEPSLDYRTIYVSTDLVLRESTEF